MPADNSGVNLRVEGLGAFKRDLQEAANTVKSLGSASKLADSELRKTGDTQEYVRAKTAALAQQIEAQQRAVDAAARGLRAAAAAYGENSKEARDWQARLNTAKTGLNNLEANMDEVTAGTDRMQRGMKGASDETKELTQIAANARFQTLNTALDKVGQAASRAASRVKQLGQSVWNAGKDSSQWADDLLTESARTGIDTQTLQQWQYAAQFVDTEVSTVTSSMQKLLSGMKSGNDAFDALGVSTTTAGGALRDTQSVFWECIGALGRMTDETARDAMAQDLFGKSFADLLPLVEAGRASWESYCDEAERAGLILSSDQVQALGSFNDSLNRMHSSFDSLVNGVMAELAPGFQEIADTAALVAQELIAWTKTDEGQETLHNFVEAIKEFVRALAGMDGGENIVQKITGAVTGLGDAAKTAADHAKGLLTALGIGAGGMFALKGVGEVISIVNGVQGLLGGGGAAAGTAAAGGGGAAAAGGAATGYYGGGTLVAHTATATGGSAIGGALTSLGVGTLGFTGGILSVLGVGALIKAMAGDPTARADLTGWTDMRHGSEQQRAKEAERQNQLTQVTQEILAAVRDQANEDADWRVREARENAQTLTGEDLRQAIEGAAIHLTPAEGGAKKSNVTLEIELGGQAVEAVLGDGEISKHEAGILQDYITKHFNPAVEEAVGMIDGGWATIHEHMMSPQFADVYEPKTERDVLEYNAMSVWVADNVSGDALVAQGEVRELWRQLLHEAGGPAGLAEDLRQSAEEAKTSGDNATWNAMVRWVQTTCGADEAQAEETVAALWTQLTTYASDPHTELDHTYTPTGATSSVFQSFVQDVYGQDYATAKATLDGWLESLNHPTLPEANGTDGTAPGTTGSTYMTGLVAELVAVQGELQTVVDSIADAAQKGIPIDPTEITRLETLMDRAAELSGEIDWYQQAEQVAGRGAMGQAMAGRNWEVTAPLAFQHAENVRQHELDAIDAELEAMRTAEGNALMDYMEAQGLVNDMKNSGRDSGEEYDAAVRALEVAEQAYTDARDAAEEAEAKVDQRKEAVEREYRENMAEIANGAAKANGYEGGGAVRAGDVELPAAKAWTVMSPAQQEAYIRGLTGYVDGGAMAAAGSGAARGTEADANYWQNITGMTDQQRQMARLLRSNYSSYDQLIADLERADAEAGTNNAKLFRDVVSGAAGDANQTAYMQAVLAAAGFETDRRQLWSGQYDFGDTTGQDAGFAGLFQMLTGMNLSDYANGAQSTKASQMTADRAQYEALKEAVEAITGMTVDEGTVSSLEEMTALFQQVSAEKANAESGYTATRANVEAMAEAGVFKDVDWSQVDGGVIEEIVNEMAQEALDAGEQIPEGLGIGLAAGAGDVETAGETVGAAGIEGIREGAGVSSPSVYAIEAGGYIAQGLAQGILGGTDLVTAAARLVAQAAVQAMRDEMGIHSPSKVMEGLGEFTTEGFAIGIADRLGAVRDAVGAMTDAVRAPVTGYAGAGMAAGGNSYSSSGAIYIDNYNQNSAEDVMFLRDQLADLTKRELQGFGHRR